MGNSGSQPVITGGLDKLCAGQIYIFYSKCKGFRARLHGMRMILVLGSS